MAGQRIRTLKPEILEDEKTAPLSDTAFRLFTSLVLLSDDHGNARADVRWLEAQVWWAHDPKPNVLTALIELCRATLIEVYGVRGGTYAHLKGWEKHQRIDNAGKNRVPLPSDTEACPIVVDEHFAANLREPPRTAAGSGSGSGSGKGSGVDQEWDGRGDSPPATNKYEKPKSGKPRKQIPADWKPRAEEREKCAELGVDCNKSAAAFHDYHTGKGEPMKDWDACFRTWIRNEVRWGRNKQTQQRSVFDVVDAVDLGDS